jgi:chaperonin GroEL
MIVKQLFFDNAGQNKLRNGIHKIAKAVGSTLGPRGNTVLLESEQHVGGITVTKDGITVARTINLFDPVENLAVQLVRQASDRTSTVAGDGTTTSVVLTEALIDAADEYIEEEHNKTEVIRNINKITDKIIEFIDKKLSKKVTQKLLNDVAAISANNDKELGDLIADAFKQVNVVTVENSSTPVTYIDIIHGMKIDRGWSSKYFVTNEETEECVLDNPYVLLSDVEINNLQSIEKALMPVIQQGRSILIIGNLSANALNALNLNVAKRNIKACHIQPPSMGWRKADLMKDLSIVLGARYYSESTGDDLSLIDFDGLGRAAKIVISKDRTIIMRHDAIDDAEISEHLDALKNKHAEVKQQYEKEFLQERIANIDGGVGVIYVGANSDIEQKEKYDRVDDAVRAVAAAIEEGILPGGGIALINASQRIKDNAEDINYQAAVDIIKTALTAPFSRIVENAGLDKVSVAQPIIDKDVDGFGYDVKNDKYGDMMKMGVIDPSKVTKSALKNAVSVATTILSTEVVITNMRQDEGNK